MGKADYLHNQKRSPKGVFKKQEGSWGDFFYYNGRICFCGGGGANNLGMLRSKSVFDVVFSFGTHAGAKNEAFYWIMSFSCFSFCWAARRGNNFHHFREKLMGIVTNCKSIMFWVCLFGLWRFIPLWMAPKMIRRIYKLIVNAWRPLPTPQNKFHQDILGCLGPGGTEV